MIADKKVACSRAWLAYHEPPFFKDLCMTEPVGRAVQLFVVGSARFVWIGYSIFELEYLFTCIYLISTSFFSLRKKIDTCIFFFSLREIWVSLRISLFHANPISRSLPFFFINLLAASFHSWTPHDKSSKPYFILIRIS